MVEMRWDEFVHISMDPRCAGYQTAWPSTSLERILRVPISVVLKNTWTNRMEMRRSIDFIFFLNRFRFSGNLC